MKFLKQVALELLAASFVAFCLIYPILAYLYPQLPR